MCPHATPEPIGVVPAGGRGSRLAPYPSPKELFPIGWQPYSVNGEVHRRPKVVSQYVIEAMVRAGASQVIIVTGEHKYDILRYYGSGEHFGAAIAYVYQDEPTGMAHAVDLAFPWFRGAPVLFGMPDTVIHPPDAFVRLLDAHRSRGADLTLGLFDTSRPHKFGMVDVDGEGRVTFHMDKPRHTHLRLMWGCAVWEPSFSALLHEVVSAGSGPPGGRELVLGDVIDAALARRMRVYGHHFADGFYVDIGTYDEIIEAQQKILDIQR